MATPTTQPLKLYNDVHFGADHDNDKLQTWTPFRRLPAELRLHVWLLALRQYRLVEVYFEPWYGSQSNLYTERNHLGRLVSGRKDRLTLVGGGYAASLSPLLRVSREARQAALSFYRIHLPLPIPRRPVQVENQAPVPLLYLNPEYDVVYLNIPAADMPRGVLLLPDLLHDIRAYDPREKG